MHQFEKIDVSEEIDTNKTSASKKCMLCHYWCFKDVDLNLNRMFVINELKINAYELKNIAILNVKGVDFRRIL